MRSILRGREGTACFAKGQRSSEMQDVEESLAPDGLQRSLFPGLSLGARSASCLGLQKRSNYEASALMDGEEVGGQKIMRMLQNHSPQALEALLTALPGLSLQELLAQVSALELAGRLWLRGEQVHYLR